MFFMIACGCEWNPWTHVSYLNCAELDANRVANPVISQQPFPTETECRSQAQRSEEALKAQMKSKREPATTRDATMECDCSWSPWRANFLLSCKSWRGEGPPVRVLDRMPFGEPRGRRNDSEKACLAAKSAIEMQSSADH